MVARQIAGRDVTDSAVLAALRKIPRHQFVPRPLRQNAYTDSPLPIGNGQTISQPYIVGSMTEHLQPEKSKTVLEIGTGSGYQTAILAELFGTVYTVEYHKELSVKAQSVLSRLGYVNISFYIGDGLQVPIEPQSFDAIIVTASPADFPEILIERLNPNGRLVTPVGSTSQVLYIVSKDTSGNIKKKPLYRVRFVTMLSDSKS